MIIEFHYFDIRYHYIDVTQSSYLLYPVTDYLDIDLDIQDTNFDQALEEIQDNLLDDFGYLEILVVYFLPDFHWDYYMEFYRGHNRQLNQQWPGVVEAPLRILLGPIQYRNLRPNTEAPTTPRSSAWW